MPGTIEVGLRSAAPLGVIGVVAVLLDDTKHRRPGVPGTVPARCPATWATASGAVFCCGLDAAGHRRPGPGHRPDRRGDRKYYTQAIEMNTRIGARPFLALSRYGLARALMARVVDPG